MFSSPLFEQRPPRLEDDLQISANFTRPVYCFLFALNPDGSVQLCYPNSETEVQQQPITRLTYPPDDDLAFGLTDGVGHQAFVLVTSTESLPAFDDWKPSLSGIQWPDETISGNWIYESGNLESKRFAAEDNHEERTRGSIRRKKEPVAFKGYLDSITRDATQVVGVLFEVNANVASEKGAKQ